MAPPAHRRSVAPRQAVTSTGPVPGRRRPGPRWAAIYTSSVPAARDATTQGGPAQATQILVYKVYHDGVKSADLGGSSAQSVVLMLIVIALTVVQFRFVERKVNY